MVGFGCLSHLEFTFTDVVLCLALEYAYLRLVTPEKWKFNKALQNWIVKNIWSEEAVNIKFFRSSSHSSLVSVLFQDSPGVHGAYRWLPYRFPRTRASCKDALLSNDPSDDSSSCARIWCKLVRTFYQHRLLYLRLPRPLNFPRLILTIWRSAYQGLASCLMR